mmetsp:Transcript_51066/g.84809  ORF Transcript_51066/g.84809 Transcript_51066/m.84809 type:complete len:232 (+) Transcript_51066:1245-1940(+)
MRVSSSVSPWPLVLLTMPSTPSSWPPTASTLTISLLPPLPPTPPPNSLTLVTATTATTLALLLVVSLMPSKSSFSPSTPSSSPSPSSLALEATEAVVARAQEVPVEDLEEQEGLEEPLPSLRSTMTVRHLSCMLPARWERPRLPSCALLLRPRPPSRRPTVVTPTARTPTGLVVWSPLPSLSPTTRPSSSRSPSTPTPPPRTLSLLPAASTEPLPVSSPSTVSRETLIAPR